MSKIIIDARKLNCPEPVVQTNKALEQANEVTTIVDNEIARDNVARFGKSQDCEVHVESKNDGIYLTIKKAGKMQIHSSSKTKTKIVLFIGSDLLGRGDNQQLGSLLMQSFLHTINGIATRPETIVFLNSGVKLVVDDSPVLGELKQLYDQGIEILACGTCLSRLQLTERVRIGQVSNMYTIAETILRADKVISL